ncbi:hypothetical protein ACWD25_58250 [Streptomyces sp. NPDC002920]
MGFRGEAGGVEVQGLPANRFDVLLLGHLIAAAGWSAHEGESAVLPCPEGKLFCSGVNFVKDRIGNSGFANSLYGQEAKLFGGRPPNVAALQGGAIGGGFGLARPWASGRRPHANSVNSVASPLAADFMTPSGSVVSRDSLGSASFSNEAINRRTDIVVGVADMKSVTVTCTVDGHPVDPKHFPTGNIYVTTRCSEFT